MLVAVNFHYIRPEFDYPYKAIFGLNPEQFKSQLENLSRHGKFISAQELLFKIQNKEELDGNCIIITFDDGLKEQVDYAKPILDQMGIPACFFINPSNVIKGIVSTVHQIHLLRSYLRADELQSLIFDVDYNHLKWGLTLEEKRKAELHYNYDTPQEASLKYLLNFKLDSLTQQELIDKLFKQYFSNESVIASQLYMSNTDIQELASQFQLGSHTYHHMPLGNLTLNEIEDELHQSTAAIMEMTGKQPFAISYPYGGWEACKDPVARCAADDGYAFGFTMERAGNFQILIESLRLARFDCNDVPGGKYNKFESSCFFDDLKDRSWVF